MRRSVLVLFGILVALSLLAACSGGTTMPSGAAKLSLTMGDDPPAGVTVLSFEITVTQATLMPGGAQLLTSPVHVEMENLQTETAFLSTAGVTPGTFNSIQVSFANPEMTIKNDTGAAIGSCPAGGVCELQPTLNQSSVSFSGAPFPLTLSANTPVGLKLDFDLTKSIQTDLSITPMVSFTELPVVQQTGELEDIEDVQGQVTAIDPAHSQFTIQTSNQQTFTIATDANTQFEDFDEAGLTNGFASLAVGQTVEVDLKLMPDGSFLASKVKLEEAENQQEIKGTVVGIDTPAQFRIVVLDESSGIMGLSTGAMATVTLLPGAAFSIDAGGQPLLSDAMFASSADLMAGQVVELHRLGTSSGTSIATDHVTLKASQLTATVESVGTDGTFMLNGLPSLFASASPAVTQLHVITSSSTEFDDASGLSGLAPGNSVSVKGPIFKDTTVPELVAEKVRKR